MKKLEELQKIVKLGLKVVKKQPGLIEGLVYASSNRRTVGRIAYTTHLPSNGLEEPKSDEDFGVCVEIWFRKGRRKLVGIGQEPSDISLEAIKRALQKAQKDAVEDPDFMGFLKSQDKTKQTRKDYHDKKVIDMDAKTEAKMLAKISWETIEGAVSEISKFAKKKKLSPKQIAFILNGDNFIVRERMALATTNGIEDSDQTTIVMSFLTAMLEKENSKGSAWGARLKLDSGYSAFQIGKSAALEAIKGVGGVRIKSGKYKVVFGHQAVTELFGSLLLPHLNLGMMDFGASFFTGKYGQQVASENLNVYDDATLSGGAGSKKITCEGCPTGKTPLIEKGKLVGFLADSKTTYKMLNRREEATKTLGVDPHEIRHALEPRNGFRFSRGGGRVAGAGIGIHATNLVIDSATPINESQLLKKVGDGIFIGRLWYTYPVGGYSSGIISGTAIADCYLIRNGKLSTPILPNTIRLEDNLQQMIKNILGIANNQKSTILWASDEITHAPWVAIDNITLNSVSKA